MSPENEQLFAELVRDVYPYAKDKLTRAMGHCAADRAVQDAIIAEWEQFRSTGAVKPLDVLRAHVICGARMSALMEFRREAARKHREDAAAHLVHREPAAADRATLEREAQEAVNRAVHRMPTKRQYVLLSITKLDRSYADVARELGITTDAVRKLAREGMADVYGAMSDHAGRSYRMPRLSSRKRKEGA